MFCKLHLPFDLCSFFLAQDQRSMIKYADSALISSISSKQIETEFCGLAALQSTSYAFVFSDAQCNRVRQRFFLDISLDLFIVQC